MFIWWSDYVWSFECSCWRREAASHVRPLTMNYLLLLVILSDITANIPMPLFRVNEKFKHGMRLLHSILMHLLAVYSWGRSLEPIPYSHSKRSAVLSSRFRFEEPSSVGFIVKSPESHLARSHVAQNLSHVARNFNNVAQKKESSRSKKQILKRSEFQTGVVNESSQFPKKRL